MAATAVGAVAVLAAGVALSPPTTTVSTSGAASPGQRDTPPAAGQAPEDEAYYSCVGPPPFAGQVPEGDTEAEREANRAAEAEAFSAWREANCGSESDTNSGPPEGVPPVERPPGPPARTAPPEGTPDGPPDDPGHE